MPRNRKTQVRSVNLQRVFPVNKRKLNAHIARLTVLYEILRLELTGTEEREDLKSLEKVGFNFRKFYFICRAIGTAWEFSEEFLMLDEFRGFEEIKDRFSQQHRKEWNECVAFFRKEHTYLKKIRNDIGGHFGYPAAYYAVSNLDNAGKGMFEFHLDLGRGSSGVCFRFAEQLLAAAMSRHKKSNETSREFFDRLFNLTYDAFRHAIKSTDLVAVYHIASLTRS